MNDDDVCMTNDFPSCSHMSDAGDGQMRADVFHFTFHVFISAWLHRIGTLLSLIFIKKQLNCSHNINLIRSSYKRWLHCLGYIFLLPIYM